mmetsp:Transcript_2420/g.5614  ORF Transcript_2420/g.5614 Transcript_2420/m.5614 type:complete len:560 (-) Transcript_2420:774-2453(-)
MTILPWPSNRTSSASPSLSSSMPKNGSSSPPPRPSSAKRTLRTILDESRRSRTSPSSSALIRAPPPAPLLDAAVLALLAVLALAATLRPAADRAVTRPVPDVMRVNPVAPVMSVRPPSESSSSDSIMSSKTVPAPPPAADAADDPAAALLRAARSESFLMWLMRRASPSGTSGAIASKPWTRTSRLSMILILDRNLSRPFPYRIMPPTIRGRSGSCCSLDMAATLTRTKPMTLLVTSRLGSSKSTATVRITSGRSDLTSPSSSLARSNARRLRAITAADLMCVVCAPSAARTTLTYSVMSPRASAMARRSWYAASLVLAFESLRQRRTSPMILGMTPAWPGSASQSRPDTTAVMHRSRTWRAETWDVAAVPAIRSAISSILPPDAMKSGWRSQSAARHRYALFWTRGQCSSVRTSDRTDRYRSETDSPSRVPDDTRAWPRPRREHILTDAAASRPPSAAEASAVARRRRWTTFRKSPRRKSGGHTRASSPMHSVTASTSWAPCCPPAPLSPFPSLPDGSSTSMALSGALEADGADRSLSDSTSLKSDGRTFVVTAESAS